EEDVIPLAEEFARPAHRQQRRQQRAGGEVAEATELFQPAEHGGLGVEGRVLSTQYSVLSCHPRPVAVRRLPRPLRRRGDRGCRARSAAKPSAATRSRISANVSAACSDPANICRWCALPPTT